MYHRIIILAIIFSFVLRKTSSQNIFILPTMQISNALPVQFWLIDCYTFNEYYAPGVFHKCFCAPWNCDDTIKVQFTDDAGLNFTLDVYVLQDEENLLTTIAFEEVQSGVYEASLELGNQSPDICGAYLQLKITQSAGSQGITLPPLSEWLTTSASGSDIDWTLGSNPTVNLTGSSISPEASEILYIDYAFIAGVEYTINIEYTRVVNSGASNPRTTSLYILDNTLAVLFTELSAANEGTNTATITFTATADTTHIGFKHNSGSTNVDITVNDASGSRIVGSDQIMAKSDCLEICDCHHESILLTYSNHENFAGLVYQNASPNPEFQVRVPAVFYHQRFPEEDEVMQLDNELVVLNGVVEKQRLMTTDYLPYYFHEKMKLILKHQNLTIFDKQWAKKEAYELVEGNRQGPIKMANCWLNEKDYVQRNVL